MAMNGAIFMYICGWICAAYICMYDDDLMNFQSFRYFETNFQQQVEKMHEFQKAETINVAAFE